ncbi:MAG: PAS domain-containing protein, partial [Acidobacteria bacterium]|nr:PAS domain-containing protein [Acidobacteriota bacterium]
MSEALDDQGSLDAHASDWSLIRCIGEGILVLSAKDYRIVAASQAFLQEMKLTRDRLLGKTCQEAKACCAFPCEMEEGFALALRTAQSRCKEVEEHSHYDGSQLTKSVEVTSYPLLDAAGNLTEIMVIERDVTARKRIENELKNAVYELSILGEVTSALQSTMEMEEVLHRFLVAVTAGESLGFNRAFILLVDEEARELKGHMAVGPSSPEEAGRMWQELNQKNLPLAELLTSSHERSKNRDTAVNQAARNLRIRLDEKDHVFIRALDQKLSINVLHGRMEGVDSPPVHEELLRLLGTDCFAVVPLHFKEKRIGVLVADNFINRRPIGREDIKFLETFAYQASSAIENSQLYKELREKLVVCQLTNQSLIENQEKLLEAERLAAVGKMA